MYTQYIVVYFIEQHLPSVDLRYYVLPPHQLEPLARDRRVYERASAPDERKFSLVKVIGISLGVPDFQRDLVSIVKSHTRAHTHTHTISLHLLNDFLNLFVCVAYK